MTEHWELTAVIGEDDEKMQHQEEVLHRRGEDALVMACRRNQQLAGCRRISMLTGEVFSEIRKDGESSRRKTDIPRDDRSGELSWDW